MVSDHCSCYDWWQRCHASVEAQVQVQLEQGSVTAPRIAQTLGFVIIKVVCALSTLRANPAVDSKWALLSAVGCLN